MPAGGEPTVHIVAVYADYEYNVIRGVFFDLEAAKDKARKVYKEYKKNEDHLSPDGASVESWEGTCRVGFWNYRPEGY